MGAGNLSHWKKVSLSLRGLTESFATNESGTRSARLPKHANQRALRYEQLQERKLFAGDLKSDQTFNITVAATQSIQYGPQQWPSDMLSDTLMDELIGSRFSVTSGASGIVSQPMSQSIAGASSVGNGNSDSNDRSFCSLELYQQVQSSLAALQSQLAALQASLVNASPGEIPAIQNQIAALTTEIAQNQSFLDQYTSSCGTSGGPHDRPLDYEQDDSGNSGNTAGNTQGTNYGSTTGTSSTSATSNTAATKSTSFTNNGTSGTHSTNATWGTKPTNWNGWQGTDATHGTQPTKGTQSTNGTGVTGGTNSTNGTSSSNGTNSTNGTGVTNGTNGTHGTGNTTYTGTTSGSSGSQGSSGTRSTQGTDSGNVNPHCGVSPTYSFKPITSPLAPVTEGQTFLLGGILCGPVDRGGMLLGSPQLTVKLDLNFDGSFDASETMTNVSVDAFYGTYSVAAVFQDDGPSPGNYTISDEAQYEISYQGATLTGTITSNNANPYFDTEPLIATKTVDLINGDQATKYSVFASIADDGMLDRHRLRVTWPDGQVTSGPWSDKTLLDLTYIVTVTPNTPSFVPQPIIVTVIDDDSGESTFVSSTLDVTRNDDDDNVNKVQDRFDGTPRDVSHAYVDNDLVQVDLSHIMPAIQSLPSGSLYFSTDYGNVQLWGSQDKTSGVSMNIGSWASGSAQLWVEGYEMGSDRIHIFYANGQKTIPLATIHCNVWGIDLDIDSDNNNGLALPERNELEESLEDHEYALGKLIYPYAAEFTPVVIQMPSGIDPAMTNVHVRLEFQPLDTSGEIEMWSKQLSDPTRNVLSNRGIDRGGDRIYPFKEYSLKQLRYNAGTGQIIVYVRTLNTNPIYFTKKGVDLNGKPDDRIKAVLVSRTNQDIAGDEVKYMSVERNSFYDNVQNRREVRSALASDGAYSTATLPQFALQKLSDEELRNEGFTSDTIERIGSLSVGHGYRSIIYKDYVSLSLVLAYAGTNDPLDIAQDLKQSMGFYSTQYDYAVQIGRELLENRNIADRLIVTGHSLGGGLASATAIVGGIRADTFNAAGVHKSTILRGATDTNVGGITNRYDSASSFINAYYVDYDMLSHLQDESLLLPDALGHRIVIDGPYNYFEIQTQAGFLLRLDSHRMRNVFYGLLRGDSPRPWDAFGY